MSKTQTLFTVALLVLLGSMGAAQAQNTFASQAIADRNPESTAREGWRKRGCPAASWFTGP